MHFLVISDQIVQRLKYYVGWGSEDTVLPSEVAEMGLLAADLSGINLHKGSEETSEVSVPYLCLKFRR